MAGSYALARMSLANAIKDLNVVAAEMLMLGHYQDAHTLVSLVETLTKMHGFYRNHAESEARREQASESRTPNCSVVPTRDTLGDLPPAGESSTT